MSVKKLLDSLNMYINETKVFFIIFIFFAKIFNINIKNRINSITIQYKIIMFFLKCSSKSINKHYCCMRLNIVGPLHNI